VRFIDGGTLSLQQNMLHAALTRPGGIRRWVRHNGA
jgi:hypothetical protein